MDAAEWDERYASAPLVWSAGPNVLFAELTEALPPGRALDLGCGEGRTALWLAARGWTVDAVDFSSVAIEKGAARAQAEGLDVAWHVGDVTSYPVPAQRYDLVAVLYLHLPPDVTPDVLRRAASAVAPGGRLVVLGHDRDNLRKGVGGPQDPDLLYTTAALAEAAADLSVERLEQVPRPTSEGVAIDTLLVATRPHAGVDPGSAPS